MNNIDLDAIWKELDEFRLSQGRDEKNNKKSNNCCDNKINLIRYTDGITCKICGIINSVSIDDTGYSDQHSIMIEGMSSGFSNHPLSKKLENTNHKANACNNKKFQKQKGDWELSNYIKERVACTQSGINDSVITTAVSLFRMFESKPSKNGEKTIVRRNVRSSIISACLYLACKKHENFRTPVEIAEIMGVEKSLVIKGCKLLREKIFVKHDSENTVDISQIIPRVCSDLNLPYKYQKKTISLYSSVKDNNDIQKYDPRILSAALLYSVCLKNGIEEVKDIKKDITIILNISELSMSRLSSVLSL